MIELISIHRKKTYRLHKDGFNNATEAAQKVFEIIDEVAFIPSDIIETIKSIILEIRFLYGEINLTEEVIQAGNSLRSQGIEIHTENKLCEYIFFDLSETTQY
jgi:hypothetical protein